MGVRAAKAIAFLGIVVGLVAGLDDLFGWGPLWPTDPEIHPQSPLNGSSLILPFTVRNRSTLFDMKDVEFTCGIDQVYFRDASGNMASFPDMAFANGTYSIGATDTINYACDASQLIRIRFNGKPLPIEKVCVWIRGDYRVLGLVPRHFTSVIFQWPAAPGVPQWLEGPVYHEGKPVTYNASDYGTPFKIVDCSPVPPTTYKRFRDGHLEIVKDGHVMEVQ